MRVKGDARYACQCIAGLSAISKEFKLASRPVLDKRLKQMDILQEGATDGW